MKWSAKENIVLVQFEVHRIFYYQKLLRSRSCFFYRCMHIMQSPSESSVEEFFVKKIVCKSIADKDDVDKIMMKGGKESFTDLTCISV